MAEGTTIPDKATVVTPAYAEESDDKVNIRSTPDDESFMRTVKSWWRVDVEHSAPWRKEAREDYDFVAGRQFSEEDKAEMRDKMRPLIEFNRIEPIVNAVVGLEIQNRQETRFIPREMGDVKVNELLTSAGQFLRDECDAEDEDSDAFLDAVICGMGWTEHRIDSDDNPQGDYADERIDPFEMVWDHQARKRNLTDARRLFRVREYTLATATEMFPGFEPFELHAGWTADLDDEEGEDDPHQADKRLSYNRDDDRVSDPGDKVRVVHVVWWEREDYYKVADPMTGTTADLSVEEYETALVRMNAMGMPLQGAKMRRRVFKQRFLGSIPLTEATPSLCPDHFPFQAITGKRDQNKGLFYGVVRAMKEPQRFASKFMSDSLAIMGANAKGGLMAERGAFDNDDEAEKTWSDPTKITWLKQGTLAAGRIQQKQMAPMPPGAERYLDFAISSIRDTSGVNLELLGLRDATQPGILEAQRKQAGMTILAFLFDNLKRYRRNTGRILLYLIKRYLADGRLVKIVGQEQEQYVPLLVQADLEFDVIVDDAPTSPNQKEQVWASILQLMPMLQNTLPPEGWLELAKYSPLPSQVLEKTAAAVQQAQQGQAQQAQQTQQLMQAQMQVENAKTAAEAGRAQADAQLKLMQAQVAAADPNLQLEAKRQEKALDVEVDLQKTALQHLIPVDQLRQNLGVGGVPGAGPAPDQVMQALQAIAAQMGQLQAAVTGPKQVIYGPDGRPVGVRSAAGVQQVQRGPDGRVQGLS